MAAEPPAVAAQLGGSAAGKRESLVAASREKYVSRQKKYVSKRKKESDVLARIKQFKSGEKARDIVVADGEGETRDGKSILRQLDEILQG